MVDETAKGHSISETDTMPYEYNITVGTAAVQVLQANPNRVQCIISNLGESVIYLGLTRDVSTTAGIPVSSNGGVMILHINEDYTAVTYDWYGISAVTGQMVHVFEVVKI